MNIASGVTYEEIEVLINKNINLHLMCDLSLQKIISSKIYLEKYSFNSSEEVKCI